MPIGYLSCPGRGETDPCIARAAAMLAARGVRLAGTVAAGEAGDGPCCDALQVLPDGPVMAIRQDLGTGASGCRLDGTALEAAVAAVRPRLAGAEILVVNKFGKIEAIGRGFVPLIAEAVDRGLPVLVGVSGLNLPDFLAFADGLAERLPPHPEAAAAWVLAAVGPVGA